MELRCLCKKEREREYKQAERHFPEFKLALVQLTVGASKGDNVARAVAMVKQAASAGASLVALPVSVSSVFYLFTWHIVPLGNSPAGNLGLSFLGESWL